MNNENTFYCKYSTEENQEVLNIRKDYLPREENELETPRRLDTTVKRPANVFAYVYGSVSAVIMGAGMSLVMTDLGTILGLENSMIPGIAIGIAGLIMALTTCSVHKRILNSRKKKYAPEIIKLSEKLMKN